MKQSETRVTHNYDIFKCYPSSRDIRPNKVAIIKDSMSQHDLRNPLIVNEKFYIIDGNHTLHVRKLLKLDVPFTIIHGLTEADIPRFNINRTSWDANDYAKHYAVSGNENYTRFREFCAKYNLSAQIAMAMLDNQGVKSKVFNSGLFEITNMSNAVKKANKLNELLPFYKGAKRRSFVLALLKALKNKKFDLDEFVRKVQLHRALLYDCATVEQNLKIIQTVYNYKRESDEKIDL